MNSKITLSGPPEVRVARWKLQTFRSLRHRNYRLLWMGVICSSAGQWMEQVALGWLVLDLTDSAFWVGAVNGVRAVPFLLFSPWGGVLADRVNRRFLILSTQIGTVFLALIMAALNFTGEIELWHIFAITFTLGILWSVNNPSRQALMVNVINKDDLMNAIALQSMGFNMTRIIGPFVGGVLLATAGIGWTFLLAALIYMIAAATTQMVKFPSTKREGPVESPWKNFLGGLQYVRNDRTVMTLILMAMVPMIFAFPHLALMPVFARDIFNMGPTGLGLLYASSGIGALSTTFILASLGDITFKGKILLGGGITIGVALLTVALSPWNGLAFFALAMAGGGMMGYMATNNTLIQSRITDEVRGRVLSILMMDFGLTPVGALLAGTVASLASPQFALGMMGVAMLSFSLLALATMPAVRKLA